MSVDEFSVGTAVWARLGAVEVRGVIVEICPMPQQRPARYFVEVDRVDGTKEILSLFVRQLQLASPVEEKSTKPSDVLGTMDSEGPFVEPPGRPTSC